MKIMNLELNNTKQLNKLMPLYFNYESELTKLKIEEIFDQEKPKDYQVLLDWLDKALELNGFYILGIQFLKNISLYYRSIKYYINCFLKNT